ncbi:MAG TPA: ABC transporter substrate-binding protein, partial [Bordetella sp.]|nr:ABC transporter substrate-binding protein [Bordetella sp.]
MQRRTFLGTAALAALGAKLPAPAWARQYPSRPINYIVAYTPGSANDILVRLIAPKLDKFLNGTVVVINKPGAGGSVGM